MLPCVLIVDDDDNFLSVVRESLEGRADRFRLLTANSGQEAVRLLEAKPVDLLVTDLRMPGMDGFELLAHVMNRSIELSVCVITGYSTPETVKQLHRMGIMRIWEKPINFKDFAEYIENVLSGSVEGTPFEGISIGGFLQLVHTERKTCFLEVLNRTGEKGAFLFQDGEAYDAVCGDLRGETAALTIISWEKGRMYFKKTPAGRKFKRRINKPLLAVLMEATRMRDEGAVLGDEEAWPETTDTRQDNPDVDWDAVEPAETDITPTDHEVDGRNHEERSRDMANLSEHLKEMAGQIEGVIAIGVVGMDGIGVAHYNPNGADIESFDAKFSMVMKLADKSINDIKALGKMEENLIQTDGAWVLSRFLNERYWLGIAVSREATLGNVRLVANKFSETIARAIA
jgi:CheY-like chemotaxis protein/predicted regulator of Ras-like GTPase activity (Roadblock/LC7/MglB family)